MDPEDLADALDDQAQAPQSMTNDQGTVSERSADDIIKLAGTAAAVRALNGGNSNGGSRSAIRLFRPAKTVFGGFMD